MKRMRLILKSCLMLLTVIMLCIICGFYGTSTALASEYSEPVSVKSEYNETPVAEDANNCDGLGYLPPNSNLTKAENRGRCTWYLWTGGNDKYYREIAKRTNGSVDLLDLVDSRKRDERFKLYGTINEPECEKATEPDEYGLWLDKCKDPQSTGVIGLRKFKNPDFDPAKWNPVKYAQNAKIEPPYRIGQSCSICHVAFNPDRKSTRLNSS